MRTRFDEQLEQLNMLLIDMGALCEEAINYAVGALNEGSEKMLFSKSVPLYPLP